VYPQYPEGITQKKFNQLIYFKKNWDFSYEKLTQINKEFNLLFKSESFSIVVSGSYGRMEACDESDLDYMILSDDIDDSAIAEIRDNIEKVATELNINLPNITGVFSKTIKVNDLIDKTGSQDDYLCHLAQRMLLLMETKPIYNKRVFEFTVNKVFSNYLTMVRDEPEKEALFLLNDLIRYFRSIAVNYEFNFWKDNDKWAIRNVKLRHSRVLIYAGLLLLILNSSKYRKNKYEYLSNRILLTPIEKIIDVYLDNNDYNFLKLLDIYDIFLEKISDKNIRNELRLDYHERHKSPHYHHLKVSSQSFLNELTRFVFAQKGNWGEQIFEYLIF